MDRETDEALTEAEIAIAAFEDSQAQLSPELRRVGAGIMSELARSIDAEPAARARVVGMAVRICASLDLLQSTAAEIVSAIRSEIARGSA